MPKNYTIHVRVDENVKINAEQTLAMLGLTISEAVNMMLCQVNLTGGLPFQVKLPAPENIIPVSKNNAWKTFMEGINSFTDDYFDIVQSR